MRYFKCPHANKTEKEIYKAQLAVLDERAKRLVRKEKFLSIVIGVIFLAVVIAAFSLFNMFFTFQFPESDILLVSILLSIVECIFMILLFLALLIVCIILGALASAPFANMMEKDTKALKKSAACICTR